MNTDSLIVRLNQDLGREYAHWHFYINAAARVEGLHRAELAEFLKEQAESEMEHVLQFSKVIVGLGGTPNTSPAYFNNSVTDAKAVLQEALRIELEVVENYTQRLRDAEESDTDSRYVHIFIEDQLQHSREDADEIKQMLKGL